MTTARSERWTAAFAKLEALITGYHDGRVTPASARPVHHEGCTLDVYHEGDCVITRPSHPYAGHFIAGCLLILAMMLGGCAARAQEPAPAPVPAAPVVAAPYKVDQCADYAGHDATMIIRCNNADTVIGASCEIAPAVLTLDAPAEPWTPVRPSPQQWGCETVWSDEKHGGRICVHITCEPADAAAAKDFLPRFGDGTNGCDVCGETP